MSSATETSSPFPGSNELPKLLLDDPDADFILYSNDGHEFRVPSLYVSKVSPVLRERIQTALNSHVANSVGSLPSIRLSDSGSTLSNLLTFVLPMLPVPPSTIEQTMILLSVAQKYQMDPILSHIRAILSSQNPPFIRPKTAFHIYSLAQTYGLRHEVLHAARTTLTLPFTLEDLEEELDKVPGIYLHELWKYYQRVRTYLTSDLAAFKKDALPNLLTCLSGNPRSLTWMDPYIDSIAACPALLDPIEFHLYYIIRQSLQLQRGHQSSHETLPSKAMHVFWEALTTVVHSCMTKAESDLSITGGSQNGPSTANPKNVSPMLHHLDMEDVDIVIQSCDLVNFRVHKSALAMSSPFFDNLLSLPQPAVTEAIDGLPVVQLSEDAEVLNNLLAMLYPVVVTIPDSYDKALSLLAASQKYDMVGVQSRIRAEIQGKKFPIPTGQAAFRAFAIASGGGLQSELKSSACLTLDFPMTFEFLCDELPFFEGWALHDLIGLRKRCRDALVSCFRSFLDLSQPPFNIWVTCTSSDYDLKYRWGQLQVGCSPSWLTEFFQRKITELDQAFTQPLLRPSSVREGYMSALQTHLNTNSCLSCMKIHAFNGEMFCNEVESRLTAALDKVGTHIYFWFGRFSGV